MFHDEVYRASPVPTTETFADVLGWRYAERRSFLVVKRAQSDIVYTSFAECYEVGNDFDDIGAVEDFVYSGLVYHGTDVFMPTKVRYLIGCSKPYRQ